MWYVSDINAEMPSGIGVRVGRSNRQCVIAGPFNSQQQAERWKESNVTSLHAKVWRNDLPE
jgi:hypothetical protein